MVTKSKCYLGKTERRLGREASGETSRPLQSRRNRFRNILWARTAEDCAVDPQQKVLLVHTQPLFPPPHHMPESVPAPSGQKLPHFVLDFLKITPLTKTRSHSGTVLGLDPKLTKTRPLLPAAIHGHLRGCSISPWST